MTGNLTNIAGNMLVEFGIIEGENSNIAFKIF